MMKVRRVGENSEVYILLFLRTAPRRKGLVSGVCLILKFIVPKLVIGRATFAKKKDMKDKMPFLEW